MKQNTDATLTIPKQNFMRTETQSNYYLETLRSPHGIRPQNENGNTNINLNSAREGVFTETGTINNILNTIQSPTGPSFNYEMMKFSQKKNNNSSHYGSTSIQFSHHKSDSSFYDPYKIPADWQIAQQHALSRRVADFSNRKIQQLCPCCGYRVYGDKIDYFADIRELNFLGSGFPCFYNFLIYCMFMLFITFCIVQGYNLITNYISDYCYASDETKKNPFQNAEEDDEKQCHDNWAHRLSLANQLNHQEFNEIQQYLSFTNMIVILIFLIFLRRAQRKIDIQVDVSQATPSDYTVMASNIKQNQNFNYQKELTRLFTEEAVPGQQLKVEQVVLVYNIEEILQKQHELEKLVKKKQKFLEQFGWEGNKPELDKINQELQVFMNSIEELEEQIPKDPELFTGIAFISFSKENEKEDVITHNPQSEEDLLEQTNGPQQDRQILQISDQMILVREAPQPNDVDWEFLHVDDSKRLKGQIFSYMLSTLVIMSCFAVIRVIAIFQSNYLDKVVQENQNGKFDQNSIKQIQMISFCISILITMFNKFVLGKVFHYITDFEKLATKTEFNISFAVKFAIALFMNTAVIAYVVEIIGFQNYWGPGGFIYTETMIFVMNGIIPPISWLLDPWTNHKNLKRHFQWKKAQNNQCYLTQQQLNELMQDVDYIQGKRYSEVIKTMWFTFFYMSCIPIGVLLSFVSLLVYYYVDQYNVLRRRTIQQSISSEVSIQMIELLEFVLILGPIGNITFSYYLFGKSNYFAFAELGIGFIYMVLPMQKFTQMVFPLDQMNEEITYRQAQRGFQTDYDRQNPITKHRALRMHRKKFQLKQDGLINSPSLSTNFQI